MEGVAYSSGFESASAEADSPANSDANSGSSSIPDEAGGVLDN
jgi:hypothetical protein